MRKKQHVNIDLIRKSKRDQQRKIGEKERKKKEISLINKEWRKERTENNDTRTKKKKSVKDERSNCFI